MAIQEPIRGKILGLGTDIIECLRIAKMIEKHGELFIGRVYTEQEIRYCAASKLATQHYAGRWAAKEAVLKSLGAGWIQGSSWRDIEILKLSTGAPTVQLHGGVNEAVERIGIQKIHLSISHCRSHATATAIAEG